MGISMGAAIALRLLLSQHLDIRGASLVRPAFDEHPYPANLEVMPVIGALLTNRGKDGYADFLTTPEYAAVAHTSESAALSLRQQFRKSRAEERAIRLLEVPRNTAYDSRRDLGDVRVPAQVLGAHGDPVHPLQLARIWADNIPGATYVDVPSRDADPKGYDTTMRQAVREHIDATFPS
jgi:pimeloyl-ACP methyl ester carboxylesterase